MIRMYIVYCLGFWARSVQVPNNEILGYWAIVILVEVLRKYVIIGYLDPWGKIAYISQAKVIWGCMWIWVFRALGIICAYEGL